MIRICLGITLLLVVSINSYAIGPGGLGTPPTGMGAGVGAITPPAGIVLPPCVATRTCTPADFAGITPPTPPAGVTPPAVPPCVATRTCTPADLVGLLPPGFTPPTPPATPPAAP
jgi:hypothetical protein